ncbi:MAG: photosystem II stability/assembly factor-like uncharacterized protein [Verrucomicrobiales bacterium]|jgi:photosystem II stability/assembly factor-like uncharacterized protein
MQVASSTSALTRQLGEIFALILMTCASSQAEELQWEWEEQNSGFTTPIRALCAVNKDVCWFGTGNGTIGRTTDGGKTWKHFTVAGAEDVEFRDVEAFDALQCIAMSVGEGNASRIYRTLDGGKNWTMVFQNDAPKGFFDGLAFWDEQNGILAGDPVDEHLVILRTVDGGATWEPIASTPTMKEGEHAFAASGTHLAVAPGGHVWVGTGGSVARIFYSSDFGKSWTIQDTPMIAGEPSTGIFSIAFKDSLNGLAVGGDYTKEATGDRNALSTSDGGNSWSLLESKADGDSSVFSFRSCVRYVQDSNLVIAVGPNGCDLSRDEGMTWASFGDQGFHTFSAGGTLDAIWAAGADGRIGRLK